MSYVQEGYWFLRIKLNMVTIKYNALKNIYVYQRYVSLSGPQV